MADNGSTITIGGSSKSLRDADADWITSQVNGRTGDVCVVIKISTNEASVTFATHGCPKSGGGGGGGTFRPKELEIIDRWNKKGLGEPGFKLGPLVSFVKDLQREL